MCSVKDKPEIGQIFVNGTDERAMPPGRTPGAAGIQCQRRLQQQTVEPAVGQACAKADAGESRGKLKAC